MIVMYCGGSGCHLMPLDNLSQVAWELAACVYAVCVVGH